MDKIINALQDYAPPVVSFIADFLTIFASGIVVYLFVAKKDSIKSMFNVLLNYSFQMSLSELNSKLDHLNDLNADNEEHAKEVVNILNEVVGQIRGNTRLKRKFKSILHETESYADKRKKITEPRKRALVSEIRESLRHVDVENFDELIGGT